MSTAITANLARQAKAMSLLLDLLREEFSLLGSSDPAGVSGLELSVQELIRQIAGERASLKAQVVLSSASARPLTLTQYVESRPEPERAELSGLVRAIDAAEQACARQSEKNGQLALALYDQSRSLIAFVQERVAPREKDVYAANGRMAKARAGAALVRGRL